jgi:hypothetical protein
MRDDFRGHENLLLFIKSMCEYQSASSVIWQTLTLSLKQFSSIKINSTTIYKLLDSNISFFDLLSEKEMYVLRLISDALINNRFFKLRQGRSQT